MDIQSDDTVLEVGFGPGLAIQEMLADGRVAHIVGIDNSPLMVEKARTHYAQAIQDGKLMLMEADVRQLPDFGRKFDKIVAINTTMYWPPAELEHILGNLRKCLTPGGKLFISLQRLYEAYAQGKQDREIKGYYTILHNAGFLDVTGVVQNIPDPEAAIAEGRFICMGLHGTNPILSM
jgi:SAM-dependent methyltransferase